MGLRSSTARLVAALGAYLLLYLSWLVFDWIPAPQTVVGPTFFQLIAAAAAWTSWSASRRARGCRRLQWAWRLMSLGLVAFMCGSMTAEFYEVVLDQKPYPSLADPVYLVLYPLMLGGLLLMPGRRQSGGRRMRSALDLTIVAVGGAAAVWYVVLGPTATTSGLDALTMAFSIAYPVGDLLLVFGTALALFRSVHPGTRSALWLTAITMCVFVVADLIYGWVLLNSTYSGGDPVDGVYVLGMAFMVVAGTRQPRAAELEGSADAVAGDAAGVRWLPPAAVAIGFGTLLLAQRDAPFFPDLSLVLTALLLAALVSARQLVAQRELVATQRALRRSHDELRAAHDAQTAAVAEQARMELELRLAQKLEAVGQLAAGIAHEINTPIQFVGDTGRFLDDAVKDLLVLVDAYRELYGAACDGPVAPELLERVAAAEEDADLEYLRERIPAAFERSFEGIDRVANIVGAMRSFAHPPTLERWPVDLNDAIRTTLVVAANEYKYVADIETDLGELPPVVCNAGDINQVLLNLVVNAAHAIGDVVGDSGARGTIRIRSRRDADNVTISIADSGCGIPPAIANRVFDPFFTTKDVGRGTGQGLAIARTVVTERHDGVITFETAPDRGTTFHVRLPIGVAGAADRAAA